MFRISNWSVIPEEAGQPLLVHARLDGPEVPLAAAGPLAARPPHLDELRQEAEVVPDRVLPRQAAQLGVVGVLVRDVLKRCNKQGYVWAGIRLEYLKFIQGEVLPYYP